MNFLKFTQEKLSVETISDEVTASNCGALSIFVGTTRDNFEGKEVVTLEYEAYEAMGIKKLETICEDIRNKWGSVENIAIYHRLGVVPVKEASIVIAISSPHREEAIKATEYCINTVKTSVPIWKKEIYAASEPEWKENKELPEIVKCKKSKIEINQEINVPYIPPHLIQIKASNDDINIRINKFMERKRSEIDINNIREFCTGDRNSEFTCARIDAVLKKRKDSKSHLEVNRVINAYHHRDQTSSDYLKRFMPQNGIDERLENIEVQLSMSTPVPKLIFQRLKELEDRVLYLESVSPEYIQFWDKASVYNAQKKSQKKRIFSIEEIDLLILDTEKRISSTM